jgi:hypothetical protein
MCSDVLTMVQCANVMHALGGLTVGWLRSIKRVPCFAVRELQATHLVRSG